MHELEQIQWETITAWECQIQNDPAKLLNDINLLYHNKKSTE